MSVSSDRWSCSRCFQTVVIHGTPEDVQASIAACQTRHAREHRDTAKHLARFLAETKPIKKRGAA